MQTIYLDISNKGVIPTVYAKQNDIGRKFAVILTDSGLPYIPVSGSAFSVWYKGASGEGNYTDIGEKSAFSVNENEVTVEMIAQMLSNDGEGILSLVLNDNGGNQIGLWSIRYVCESVPGANSEEAKEYYSAFSESVKKLSDTDAILRSKLSVDGTNTMEANLPMGNHRVTDLSAPVADGDAVNLAYTKKVGNPHNLLDNSDFRNPVNQRGVTVSANGFIVDRWYVFNRTNDTNDTVTLTADGIVTNGDSYLQQRIPKGIMKDGEKYTLAVYYSDGTVDVNTNGEYMIFDGFDLVNHITSNGKTIASVALYEGEYTSETLPEYQPKGYGAELAECMRYYYRNYYGEMPKAGFASLYAPLSGKTISVMFPTPMRVTPTITLYNPVTGHSGCVADWATDADVIANVIYSNEHNFIVGGDMTEGQMIAYNYEASADL